MDDAISLAITFALGGTGTFQAALIGAITRSRGGREASIVSPLSSLVVVAALLTWIAFDEGQTKLPAPFDSGILLAALVPLCAIALFLTIRGLPYWYASVGFFAAVGLVLVPRLVGDLGLALYFSAATFGMCAGALAFDHRGVFGAAQRPATLQRVGGLALVGVGVVLVRIS